MLQLVATSIGAVSLLIAATSGLLAFRTLRATHDWNRRKAAQDATLLLNDRVKDRKLLKEHLDYVSSFEPIPLAELCKALDAHPDVRIAVHDLLNYFEMLARGVQQNVYDEEVIRTAFEGSMSRAVSRFGPYIQSKHAPALPKAWEQLVYVVNEWKRTQTERARRISTA